VTEERTSKRRRVTDEPRRVITFKLPVCVIERLDGYCRKYGITRSEAIRQAVIEFLRYRV